MYTLRIRVGIDDTYDAVHNLFKYMSVQMEFWTSFIPPNHMYYNIIVATQQQTDDWKQKLDATGCKYSLDEISIND